MLEVWYKLVQRLYWFNLPPSTLYFFGEFFDASNSGNKFGNVEHKVIL